MLPTGEKKGDLINISEKQWAWLKGAKDKSVIALLLLSSRMCGYEKMEVEKKDVINKCRFLMFEPNSKGNLVWQIKISWWKSTAERKETGTHQRVNFNFFFFLQETERLLFWHKHLFIKVNQKLYQHKLKIIISLYFTKQGCHVLETVFGH